MLVAILTYVVPLDQVDAHRPAHIDWLKDCYAQGVMLASGRKNPPGVSGALSASSADSVPIPLLVLAAIAVLLLAAGSAGFIARRLQARKVQLGPPAGTPQAPSQQ